MSGEVAQQISKQLEEGLIRSKTAPSTWQWEYPFGFNQYYPNKVKPQPEGRVSYTTLRQFSINYAVARACIDYLKTKVTKLDWTIGNVDKMKDVDKDDARVKLLEQFFKHPLGYRSKYRSFIDAVIEDYLVIGAIALERRRTRGGQFSGELKLVDAATIKPYVDVDGRTPNPPDYAYAQEINGQIVAQLTRDELIYEVRNGRTNTVFGLSPIESIMIQAESAIKGGQYSLAWFSDGNVPEGFGEVPESWTVDQIKQFQSQFDAIISGNAKQQNRIRMVPKGFNYTPAKKPDSIGYDRFELWILQLTCSVFGVPPQDIGFTMNVNKSSSDTQQELGQERGMRPLVSFLADVFNDIIQEDFGFKDLCFVFNEVNPIDRKTEAEIDSIRIADGVIGVDEIRAREGREPIGIGPYIRNGKGIVFLSDNQAENKKLLEEYQDKEDDSEQSGGGKMGTQDTEKEDDEEATQKAQKEDLITWRKQSNNSLKRGRDFKRFESKHLDDWIVDEIYQQLKKVKKKEQIDQVFEPYLNGDMSTLQTLQKLSNAISRLTTKKD